MDSGKTMVRQRIIFLLAVVLVGIVTLFTVSQGDGPRQERKLLPGPTSLTAFDARGTFHVYPFPHAASEAMRPVLDHEGRVWFGDMGQNALVFFDARTKAFTYLTPPYGHHGIMGVIAAPDDTIWFAEQFANYLGHYIPATGRFQFFPLPWLTVSDPGQPGRVEVLPSAPNELALDGRGQLWFTEFNADRLGRLDPKTGRIQQYALSTKTSVQTLYPYGVTIDRHGMIWFTESGTNRLGRLDPVHGTFRFFTAPDPHLLFMEVVSDASGDIWVTSFTPGLLLRLHPDTNTFTSYRLPFDEKASSALYGLLVTSTGEIWVTLLAENVIARLDIATQRLAAYHIPGPGGQPLGLAMDESHDIWFTGVNEVGMLHPEQG